MSASLKQNDCQSLGANHNYTEEYYGYRCIDCDQFIPYGCEPWLPDDDEVTIYGDTDLEMTV